jgi:hypothetical protein
MVKSICGLIVYTNNLEKMKEFYTNVLGIKFYEEKH